MAPALLFVHGGDGLLIAMMTTYAARQLITEVNTVTTCLDLHLNLRPNKGANGFTRTDNFTAKEYAVAP